MSEEVDDSQINPIFLQQLQDALESDHDEPDNSRLGNDDQLLFDSLRSIISGDSTESHQQQNWNQMLDGNPDPNTLEAVQTALRELGGSDVHPGSHSAWGAHPLTEEDRDRIRNDNRARKRKWRDTNVTRNRDHDLRSRIVRRANIMFGERETEEKHKWIEDEFHRRKERRFMKDPTDFSRMFRNSNNSLEPGALIPQVHAPRPPAFFTKFRPVPSARIPLRILSIEACMMGKPMDLMAHAKQLDTPKPAVAADTKPTETKPKKPVFEKFGLPALPADLAKLGPMPPLPKSILDHQRKEKEKQRQASPPPAPEVPVPAPGSEVQPEPMHPAALPQDAAPLPLDHNHDQTAGGPPVAASPDHGLNDEDLENIDDMLGNALDALGQEHEHDNDPTNAIEELQAALAGQGLFE